MSDPKDRRDQAGSTDPKLDPSQPQGARIPSGFGNVPVPAGAVRQSFDGFAPISGMPSRLRSGGDDDGETTRVHTLVGAPQFAGKPQASVKLPFVTVIAGHRAGEMFRLDQEETVLGRGTSSTIHLDSDGVSRKHARIVRQGNDFILEDLGSTNGTWIEQRRIQYHRLVDGDRVQVGTEVIVRFNFHDEMEAQMQQQLYESAVRDPLTRAHNRKHFQERLKGEIAHAIRHNGQLSMVLMDIDFFKKINDSWGHPAGDAVLKAFAGSMMRVVRVEDVFARIGGEEFALLARGVDGPNATEFADRLRRGVEKMNVPWGGGAIPVTASFGVAALAEIFPPPYAPGLAPPEGDPLVTLADQRLYQAKSSGRNRVVGPL
jgi:two-component system cell cycle response regulator